MVETTGFLKWNIFMKAWIKILSIIECLKYTLTVIWVPEKFLEVGDSVFELQNSLVLIPTKKCL